MRNIWVARQNTRHAKNISDFVESLTHQGTSLVHTSYRGSTLSLRYEHYMKSTNLASPICTIFRRGTKWEIISPVLSSPYKPLPVGSYGTSGFWSDIEKVVKARLAQIKRSNHMKVGKAKPTKMGPRGMGYYNPSKRPKRVYKK